MALTKVDDRGLKTPIDLLDNEKIRFGNSDDLEIYHNGSHSYITDTGTGNLYIHSNYLIVSNVAGTEDILKAAADGAVTLYFDNSAKLATTSTGATVTGDLTTSGNVTFADSSGGANNRAVFGTGGDLNIYHNGTSSLIEADDLRLRNAAGDESFIICTDDGSVDLYHNNVKKAYTWADGFHVLGKISGDDSASLRLGASEDLLVYHDGSHSYVQDNGAGDLYVQSNSNIAIKAGDENSIICNDDGPVELYHDNVKKLETNANGGHFYGTKWRFQDNTQARWGDGEDLRMYHNGSDSYIDNYEGAVLIRNLSGDDLVIQTVSGENNIKCKPNGATEIYHDNVKKIETWSGGSTFNYYEEGSWTPGFTSTVLNSLALPLITTGSYDYRVARWVKIGPMVCISIHIQLTSNFAYETGASSSTAPIGIGGLPAALGPGVNTNPRFIPGSFVWKEGGSSGTTKTFHARISSFFNPQFIELCDEDSGGVSSLTAGDIIEDSAQFHISFAYVLGS